jgi:hypothetical protein
LVEQWFCKPQVGGSTPSAGTMTGSRPNPPGPSQADKNQYSAAAGAAEHLVLAGSLRAAGGHTTVTEGRCLCSRSNLQRRLPASRQTVATLTASAVACQAPATAAASDELPLDAGADNQAATPIRTAVALSRVAVRAGYVELLGRYEWDWFCTMTFPDAVHPERADKLWRLWCSKLNRELFGPRWHRKQHRGVFWARASEFQTRGVLHYHALVSAVVDINNEALRVKWKEDWTKLSHGFSRIYAVQHAPAVIRYVCKYVVKGGDVDLSGNLKCYVRQRALPYSD